jgi:hypothetical protein
MLSTVRPEGTPSTIGIVTARSFFFSPVTRARGRAAAQGSAGDDRRARGRELGWPPSTHAAHPRRRTSTARTVSSSRAAVAGRRRDMHVSTDSIA